MKLKYIYLALKEQGPLKRFFRNFFITKNGWGLFSKYAHYTKNGKEKIGRSTKDKARKMADKMATKTGYYYSVYRCPRCGKWHIGKNRDSTRKSVRDSPNDG